MAFFIPTVFEALSFVSENTLSLHFADEEFKNVLSKELLLLEKELFSGQLMRAARWGILQPYFTD